MIISIDEDKIFENIQQPITIFINLRKLGIEERETFLT